MRQYHNILDYYWPYCKSQCKIVVHQPNKLAMQKSVLQYRNHCSLLFCSSAFVHYLHFFSAPLCRVKGHTVHLKFYLFFSCKSRVIYIFWVTIGIIIIHTHVQMGTIIVSDINLTPNLSLFDSRKLTPEGNIVITPTNMCV